MFRTDRYGHPGQTDTQKNNQTETYGHVDTWKV